MLCSVIDITVCNEVLITFFMLYCFNLDLIESQKLDSKEVSVI